MILLRAVVVLLLVLCSGVKVHGEHDTNLSKFLQMIEKDVEAIQQAAADDKALEKEEQIPEIYEDGTKETTDEDDTSSLVAYEDDDKKRTRRQWRKIFCAFSRKTKTYHFNCNKLKKWKRKKYCRSLQGRKCRIGVIYNPGDQEEENQQEENKMENELDQDTNAYDTSSLVANEDDDKKRTRNQWRRLFCAVSIKTQRYILNCNNLKIWKRKKYCLAYQNGPCKNTQLTSLFYFKDDKALENEEQFPEIYEDGTKETTDEGEDSGVILADDDKKWKKKLAILFCRHKPNGQYLVNCDRIQIERRKKYCRSLQSRKCRVITPPVNYHGGDHEGENQQEENKMENELDQDTNAYDKALENEEQIPEIYEDGTKETTDEGEDSGVILVDDDKKWKKKLAILFCRHKPNGQYWVNCDRIQIERRKKYCRSLQGRKCRVITPPVNYHGGDHEGESQQEENQMENELDQDTNAYDTSSLVANEDDDKKRTRKEWRKLFCATSLTTQKYIFDCNKLKKWKRKKSCLAYQNGPCSTTILTAILDVASPRASLSYTALWNYKDNNKIEKDDVENSNKGKFLRLCCSVNRNGKNFNCEKLRKPRLRNKCKTIQEQPGYYCGGVNVFDGDNQTDEDSLMMM